MYKKLILLGLLIGSCAPSPQPAKTPETPISTASEIALPEETSSEVPTLIPPPEVVAEKPNTPVASNSEKNPEIQKIPPVVEAPPVPVVESIPPPKDPLIPLFNQFSIKELTQKGNLDWVGKKITFTVPYGTPINSLTPVWTSNAQSVSFEGKEITSGSIPLNWSSPRKFILLSEEGPSAEWTAEVVVSPPNREAKLAKVELGGYELVPAFNPAVPSYSLYVPESLKVLSVSALPSFGKANLKIQMNDSLTSTDLTPGSPASLNLIPGENSLFLKVVAEDNRTSTYYVIVVKRR